MWPLNLLNQFTRDTLSFEERDTYGRYTTENHNGPGPCLMEAKTLLGNEVYHLHQEDVVNIEEILIDTQNNGEVS